MKTNLLKSLLFTGFLVASLSAFTQSYSPKDVALQKIDSILTDGTIDKEDMTECFLYMADYADNSKKHHAFPATFRRNRSPIYEGDENPTPSMEIRKVNQPVQVPKWVESTVSKGGFPIIVLLFIAILAVILYVIFLMAHNYLSDSKLSWKTMLELYKKVEDLEGRIRSMEIEFNILRESVIAHSKDKIPANKPHKTDFM